MDVISTDPTNVSYYDFPPLLLAASSERAMALARRSAVASGCRIGASLAVEEAGQRIEQQIKTTALWVELDHDGGAAMDELLARIDVDVGDGRYAAVVSTTSELLDSVVARVGSSDIQVIIDADDAQRASALAIACSRQAERLFLSDVASDGQAARLRQLSEEVSRIASTLARISTGPGSLAGPIEPQPMSDLPPLSVETVRNVIRARRTRARYFHEDLFADPAWDMLLDLLQAEIAQLRVPVSSLCIAAAVPPTTALRWLKTMVSQGIFLRREDPHDGRRVFVELSNEASQAMRRYFAEVGQVAVV